MQFGRYSLVLTGLHLKCFIFLQVNAFAYLHSYLCSSSSCPNSEFTRRYLNVDILLGMDMFQLDFHQKHMSEKRQ